MRTKLPLVFVLALGLVSSSALATTYNVTQNGLVAPNQNYGCPAGSANCLTSKDYDLSGTAAASGSITLSGSVATLSFDVASVAFTSLSGPTQTFTNTHYAGTLSVFNSAGIVSQLGSATGSVSGTLAGSPFTAAALVTNLTCVISGATGNCSVMFGPIGFTAGGHDWLHTFNVVVTAVPEPALGLLALLGAALAARRALR